MLAALFGLAPGHGQEPTPFPTDPVLRLETGGHAAAINRIGVLPDGERIVSVSDDQTLRIWRKAGGAAMQILRGPAGAAAEGALYALGIGKRFVATAGRTGWDWQPGTASIRILDSTTLAPRGVLSGLPAPISALAFSPDDQELAVAMYGTGQGVRVYRLGSGQPTLSDDAFDGEATDLRYLPDGRLLALDSGGWIKVYDGSAGTILGRVPAGQGGEPWRMALSSDGSHLAIGLRAQPGVVVIDVASTAEPVTFRAPPSLSNQAEGFAHATWARQGRFLLAVGDPYARNMGDSVQIDQNVQIWDRTTARHLGSRSLLELNAELPISTLETDPRDDSRLLFGTASGAWGVLDIDAQGQISLGLSVPSLIPDFRGTGGLALEADETANIISLPLAGPNGRIWRFDSRSGSLSPAGRTDNGPAQRTADGRSLRIDTTQGRASLNGATLELSANERALAVAAIPDQDRFVLGTNFYLRGYSGPKEAWQSPVAAAAWAVSISGDGRTLVAYLGNGEVQWRRMSDGTLLRSLFVTRDLSRWAMWTPEGFFDHSQDGPETQSGADMVGYQINADYRSEAQFVGIGQLYRQFYRPDVVRAALQARAGDEVILARARQGAGDAAAALTTNRPPQLRITSVCGISVDEEPIACGMPEALPGLTRSGAAPLRAVLPDAARDSQAVEVFLEAKDMGAGIGPLDIRRNGVAIAALDQERLTRDNAQVVRMRVPLSAGSNEFLLAAYDASGKVTSQAVELSVFGHFLPPAGARTVRVLAVGIGDYAVDLFDLPGNRPANDARAIVARFVAEAAKDDLYDVADVTLLTNEEATAPRILEALAALADRAKPQDTVVLFLAGHGEVIDGDYVFAPYELGQTRIEAIYRELSAGRQFEREAKTDLFRQDGVSQTQLMRELARIPSERLIAILDTCYAGSFAEMDLNQQQDTASAVIDRVARSTGRFILAAARGLANNGDGKDYAPGFGHGLLTSVSLEALDGAGDRDRDGEVTLAELGGYLHGEVERRSRALDVVQIPVTRFAGNPYFALVHAPTGEGAVQ